MREYLKLLRVKHYIKNLLIFIPPFFGGVFFQPEKLCRAGLGFICFCALSSAVYILNDYKDREKDRNHPVKKERPLASGRIKTAEAFTIMAVCLAITVLSSAVLGSFRGAVCLLLYFALSAAYSLGLKNRPIIDIVILASGFVLRVFYGGFITGVAVSKWLYLVITAGSLYMGLGKRRNELREQKDTREVLRYYNEAFLDKNMYVCLTLTNVFYALWTFEMTDSYISWTIPVFLIMLMRYSLDVEGNSDGDPVEVILKDKGLLVFGMAYAALFLVLLYIV